MKMIKLSCKSCGAKLELTEDVDRFSCGFCGNEFLVERKGGMVVLKDVHESLKRIEQTSEAARENTQVLADQVRLPKMKKRIVELEQERDGIDLQPLMENPEYIAAIKKTDEIKAKQNGIGMLFFLASVGLLFPAGSTGNSILFILGGILFIATFIAPVMLTEAYPILPTEKIPDKNMEAENKKKWDLLDEEVRELKERVNKIENSF